MEDKELFLRIVKESSDPKSVHMCLLKIKELYGNADVIRFAMEAISRFPEDIRLNAFLAETFLDSGNIHMAEEYIDKAAEQLGELLEILKLKGKIYLRAGRSREAEDILKDYLTLKPKDMEAKRLLEGEEEHEFEEEPFPTQTLAEVYVKQGLIQDAIDIYERLLEKSPNDEALKRRVLELRAIGSKKKMLIDIFERWIAKIKNI